MLTIGTKVKSLSLNLEMEVESIPIFRGVWTGYYICVWFGPTGYANRRYLHPEDLVVITDDVAQPN